MAENTVKVELNTDEVVKTLTDFRTQMIKELGDEFIAGMNRAFDICIESLDKSAHDPRIATSQFGAGIAIAVDTLKSMRGDAIKPYLEANRNALKNTVINTATETHTGDTQNG